MQLKADYSGFNDAWVPRNDQVHKEQARAAKDAKTPQGRLAKEKEYGARWSALYELDYFEPVCHHSIDPMHCIFLGVCKRFMKLMFKLEILTDSDAQEIQQKIDRMRTPSTIGRIPRKIGSKFSSLTADEWKNWTLVYSTVCLQNRLPTDIYQIWLLFVKVTAILCKRHLKRTDITNSEAMIWKFAAAYEARFGKEECTPNLHLLCHLPSVIRNYGPVYSFWCYSFERLVIDIYK